MLSINTIETLADKELVGKAIDRYGQFRATPPLCKSITPVSFGISRSQAKIKPHERQDDSTSKPLEPDSRSYYVHQIDNLSQKEELNFIVGSLTDNVHPKAQAQVVELKVLSAAINKKILSFLERSPLTVENLADSLDVSMQDIAPIIRILFDQGYVDTMGGGVLRKIFPIIATRTRQKSQFSDTSTNFVLTIKGYLKLHPFIRIK